MPDREYEQREAMEFYRQLQSVEKSPLAHRKEAAKEFGEALRDPSLIGERIGWLFAGNYGYGGMKKAQQVLKMTARANKVAILTQMIAAVEWMCPARAAVAEWKKLTPAEKTALDKAVKAEIADEEKYVKEQGWR